MRDPIARKRKKPATLNTIAATPSPTIARGTPARGQAHKRYGGGPWPGAWPPSSRATVSPVEGAKTFAPLDQPAEIAARIARFVAETTAAQPDDASPLRARARAAE